MGFTGSKCIFIERAGWRSRQCKPDAVLKPEAYSSLPAENPTTLQSGPGLAELVPRRCSGSTWYLVPWYWYRYVGRWLAVAGWAAA